MFEAGHGYYEKLQKSANFLLVKDDVGRAKPTIRVLPGIDFTYGRNIQRDKEGAGAVTSSWQFHTPSPPPTPDRDFKALNFLSVRDGRTTPKQLTEFRKGKDVRLRLHSHRLSLSPPPPNSTVFGIRTRPSTPMNSVMSHLYGRIASELKHEEYKEEKVTSPKMKRPRMTRTATLLMQSVRSSSAFSKPQSTFKMKKFLRATARVSSFRKPEGQGASAKNPAPSG